MTEQRTARVLVVDDSAAVRRALSYALGEHPAVEVAGTAPDGAQAITAIESLLPDVVLLDLDMPVLDGMGALEIIHRRWPKLPVVIFSTHTPRGADAATRALTAGAAAAVAKPAAATPDEAVALVHNEVVPILLAVTDRASPPTAELSTLVRASPARSTTPRLIVIGSSTGGPFALGTVLGSLGTVGVPILITQHMPEGFTAPLAHHLSQRSGLEVSEATDRERLEPGMVRIAPGGLHLLVAAAGDDLITRLSDAPSVNHCRPAVDPLFTSAARHAGGGLLGVILTGMGHDGAAGAAEIVKGGGEVLVQDHDTSVVWGMPAAVAHAGHASAILPVSEIGAALRSRLGRRAELAAARP